MNIRSVRGRGLRRAAAPLGLAVALNAVAPAAPAWAAEAPGPFPFGVWRNPVDSVHVAIRPCGEGACGFVVWANEQAQADARKGGTEKLLGLELFHNLVPQAGGVWTGKVYVPDLNLTLAGTARPLRETELKARGCLAWGLLCKSQVWSRVEGPPG